MHCKLVLSHQCFSSHSACVQSHPAQNNYVQMSFHIVVYLLCLTYRWRFVTHAGFDGFSRIPVYCWCSDNNRYDTVLDLFLKGVEKYGLPSRVRCDKGTENYGISYFMLNHPQRGPDRGSIIAGKSVHNQRIERFWRDLYISCVCIFYNLFYHLEDTNLLDPTNVLDLYALHFVYLPYINYSMS